MYAGEESPASNIESPALSAFASTPKRSAFSELTNAKNYVSPNANLKLLTQVALDYPTPPPSVQHRKEKSLQILCDRFLLLYPLNGSPGTEIQLDATAAQLGVEKRRMYDIINILEAMQCAVHRRKNTYLWHGGCRLTSFLRMLRKQGEALCLSEALRGNAPKPPSPKQKTLGVLAQRFLMLFLVEPPNTLINLEMAVGVLIDTSKSSAHLSPDQLERQHKSKVRRLYDIANVLISLGLIEKVSGNQILKKPVFVYVGPKRAKSDRSTATPSDISLPFAALRTPPSSVCGRTKRKLDFSTPTWRRDVQPRRLLAQPSTPKRKWDEILEVADMELSKINNSHM